MRWNPNGREASSLSRVRSKPGVERGWYANQAAWQAGVGYKQDSDTEKESQNDKVQEDHRYRSGRLHGAVFPDDDRRRGKRSF